MPDLGTIHYNDRPAIQKLWFRHGGGFYGPRVEHANIEEQAFYRFLAEFSQIERAKERAAMERAPGTDPKTGEYSTAQMMLDEMTAGDTTKPLFD